MTFLNCYVYYLAICGNTILACICAQNFFEPFFNYTTFLFVNINRKSFYNAQNGSVDQKKKIFFETHE